MMVELVSSLGGDYIAPGLSFASFALSVPITVTKASGWRICDLRRADILP